MVKKNKETPFRYAYRKITVAKKYNGFVKKTVCDEEAVAYCFVCRRTFEHTFSGYDLLQHDGTVLFICDDCALLVNKADEEGELDLWSSDKDDGKDDDDSFLDDYEPSPCDDCDDKKMPVCERSCPECKHFKQSGYPKSPDREPETEDEAWNLDMYGRL